MQNSKGEDPSGEWGILQIYLSFVFVHVILSFFTLLTSSDI